MPKGGARIGAGRKPRARTFEVYEGGSVTSVATDGGVSEAPPEDLPQEQQDFWRRCAGLAIERRTLVAHTVPSFRLLCELEAEKQATKATIDRDGRTYIKVTVDGAGTEHSELKAHPLKADYAKLAKQVETLMARFALAPFGKPAGPAQRSKADQAKAEARAKFFGSAQHG